MFTGIIEEMGLLKGAKQKGQSMVLNIAASHVLQDLHIGDSIAVNGVCLTVVSFDSHYMLADVMPETYRKTTLCGLKVGEKVNLERAMAAGGRFGGHIVQGHVDGTGIVESRRTEDNAVVFQIKPTRPEILQFMVDQGSVALDGVSLTIVKVLSQQFTVSIIPHTLSQTVLMNRKPGHSLNIECDILGKYVSRLLNKLTPAIASPKGQPTITASYLAEHGFI